MNNQAECLNNLLTDCMKLLRSVGETFWSGRIENIVEQGVSPFAARDILGWYRGMGSFSDLIISQMNGHDLKAADESEINIRLSSLRTAIFESAELLARV